VTSVLSDVASALAMLHSRRWLHRDLSLRNVVLTTGGIAKLIDFGAMAPMGVVRTVVGTAPFVPPEMLQQFMDGIQEPGQFADLVAFYVEMNTEAKQKLLEVLSVEERLRSLLLIVQRQLALIEAQEEIQQQVQEEQCLVPGLQLNAVAADLSGAMMDPQSHQPSGTRASSSANKAASS